MIGLITDGCTKQMFGIVITRVCIDIHLENLKLYVFMHKKA